MMPRILPLLSLLLPLGPAVAATAAPRLRRHLQDDVTAPTIESQRPSAGHYTADTSMTFEAVVADEAGGSGVRHVAFQVRDPARNSRPFERGTPSTAPGEEGTWRSPPATFDRDGRWEWRVRVTDVARNVLVSEWRELFVLSHGAPSAVGMVRDAIGALVDRNPNLSPKFLRLGFHDCVGGCDGCVDLNEPDNAGLDVPIDALAPVVAEFANNAGLESIVGGPFTRADVWALATLVGTEKAANANPAVASWAMTHIGRTDCIGADVAGVGGPPRAMPSPDLTTHQLLDFFASNFAFSADETVAIMGAHSIGTARRGNSGFDGPHGWVNNPDRLSNGYHDLLVGGTSLQSTHWEMVHAPQWTLEFVNNNNRPQPSRYQWFHQKTAVNETDPRQLEKIIMLNADIALVRDLGVNGNLTAATGEVVGCQFRCGGNFDPVEGCPTRDPPVCPVATATMQKAAEYKFDNDLFLEDFDAVLGKMLRNGYVEGALTEVETGLFG